MFSYLEHIMESQDNAEIDRVKPNVEPSRKTLQTLGYAELTFEDFFTESAALEPALDPSLLRWTRACCSGPEPAALDLSLLLWSQAFCSRAEPAALEPSLLLWKHQKDHLVHLLCFTYITFNPAKGDTNQL